MKKFYKVVSLLLVFAMVCSLFPVFAAAFEDGSEVAPAAAVPDSGEDGGGTVTEPTLDDYLVWEDESTAGFRFVFDFTPLRYKVFKLDESWIEYVYPGDSFQVPWGNAYGLCIAAETFIPYDTRLFAGTHEFYFEPEYSMPGVLYSDIFNYAFVSVQYLDSSGRIKSFKQFPCVFDGDGYYAEGVTFDKVAFNSAARCRVYFCTQGSFSESPTFVSDRPSYRLCLFVDKQFPARHVRIWDYSRSHVIKTFTVSDTEFLNPPPITLNVYRDSVLFLDPVSLYTERFEITTSGTFTGLKAIPLHDGDSYPDLTPSASYECGLYEYYDYAIDVELSPWDALLSWLTGFGNSLLRLFNIEALINPITQFFKNFDASWYDNIWKALSNIGAYFTSNAEATNKWLSDLGTSVSTGINNAFNSFGGWLGDILFFTKPPEEVPEGVDPDTLPDMSNMTIWDYLMGTGKGDIWEWVTDQQFFIGVQNVLNTFGNLWNCFPKPCQYLIMFGFGLPFCIAIVKIFTR